ncbi:MAG: CHASE domain-containing protein [Magnetococcales bacterium]|nr:CHASE domain-containing protein [Magnetococcales bacterium]
MAEWSLSWNKLSRFIRLVGSVRITPATIRHWRFFFFFCLAFFPLSPLLADSQAPRRITAVVLRDFPPLYQTDADGNPAGFAVDVLQEVAAAARLELRYLTVENWEEAARALRDNHADLMPSMGVTDKWREEFLVSERVETIRVSCFVRRDDPRPRDCARLAGERVAAIRQGAAFQKLERMTGIDLVPTMTVETALFQLVNRMVDILIAPHEVVLSKARTIHLAGKITPVGEPFLELERAMMLRKELAGLLPAIDAGVRSVTQSLRYRELRHQWHGEGDRLVREGGNATRFFLFLALVVVGNWLMAWRRRVPGWSLDGLHNQVIGWLILMTSMLLTFLAWYFSNLTMEERKRDNFAFEVEEARLAIHKRMREYEQVLRGGVGLFNASSEVTRSGWHHYVKTLQIDTYWPGIQGVGFSLMVPPKEQEALVERMRQEGFADFAIKPPGERDQYSAIVFLEPFSGRNLRAFGYDMWSEKVRRSAMAQARDSGLPALSGRVTLVQETDKDIQTGVLMYLPVYRANQPVSTLEERRKALLGFVYSPFRMGDLLQGILGYGVPALDFIIYDGSEPQPEHLLYATWHIGAEASTRPARALFTQEIHLDLPGRTWLVRFFSKPSFEQAMESHQPLVVAVLGGLVDVFLFIIVLSLSGQKERIQAQARRIAKELHERDENYRIMVDNVKDVIFRTDIEGRWRFLNPAWAEITGHSVQESLGRPFIHGLHPDEHARARDGFHHLMHGSVDAVRDTFKGLHATGRPLWIEVYAIPLSGEDGVPQGVAGTLRDITLRKEFETVMVEARHAAETANRAKSEFLANISHELRTPLNSMLILAGQLARAANLSPEQSESARIIHASGTELLDLIQDLLDLSKVEAGYVEVTPEEVWLDRLLETLHARFLPVASEKWVMLEFLADTGIPRVFHTDGAKLKHILQNLLANALKFTEQGGVTLRIGRPDATLAGSAPRASQLAFCIADTGIGIPAGQWEVIFETFRQGDGSTSRKYGGSGLGLAIARKLARLLGGEIHLESREGQGSRFTLVLPELVSESQPIPEPMEYLTLDLDSVGRDRPTVRSTQRSPMACPLTVHGQESAMDPLCIDGHPVNLLVVDDDMRFAFSLANELQKRVAQVRIAANGVRALQLLEASLQVDVILLDLRMPEMDGLQTLQAIRASERWCAVPVVILTAISLPEERAACLDAGADGYLTKPVDMAEIWRELERLQGVSAPH